MWLILFFLWFFNLEFLLKFKLKFIWDKEIRFPFLIQKYKKLDSKYGRKHLKYYVWIIWISKYKWNFFWKNYNFWQIKDVFIKQKIWQNKKKYLNKILFFLKNKIKLNFTKINFIFNWKSYWLNLTDNSKLIYWGTFFFLKIINWCLYSQWICENNILNFYFFLIYEFFFYTDTFNFEVGITSLVYIYILNFTDFIHLLEV